MTNSNSTIDTTDFTKKERRYARQEDQLRNSLRSWRTPARRSLLVRANWACIVIMSAIAVAGYFWLAIVLAWLPMTVVILVVWTMLRITIDSKDSAPPRFLDEFEMATLLEARSRALNVTSTLLLVISLVLIIGGASEIGSSFSILGDGHRFAYAVGGVALMAFFVSAVIPAAAMTRTMDDEET